MTVTLKAAREKTPGVDPRQVLRAGEAAEQLASFQLINKPPFEMQQGLEGGLGAAVARWGAHVPVKLGTQVLRIDSTNREIGVITTTGALAARCVIVALPASVLGGGHFGFAPPLKPKKREAIASFSMASCLRIAVSFSQPVPQAPADSLLTAITIAGLPFQALVRPQNRNAAIVMLAAEAAQKIEEQGPSAAGAFALSALAEVYGKELRAGFTGAVASRWGRDPLSAGAWSVGPKGAAAVLAQPHDDRVLFAGEATEESGGTIEAAWASGLRAAAEAKALLR
jgi:monoamine oxidase